MLVHERDTRQKPFLSPATIISGSIMIWIQSARPRKGPGKRKFSWPYCTARFYFGLRYPRSELRLAAVVLIPGRRSFSFNVDLFVVVAESRSHMMFLVLRPIFLDTQDRERLPATAGRGRRNLRRCFRRLWEPEKEPEIGRA